MVGSDKNTEQNQAFNFPLTLKIISQINSIILLLLEGIFIKPHIIMMEFCTLFFLFTDARSVAMSVDCKYIEVGWRFALAILPSL